MEHHFHELTLAQWCILLRTINALLHYYARKKLPKPPIINTAQYTYFRIDFQRPYKLDRFCSRYMYGLAYGMA